VEARARTARGTNRRRSLRSCSRQAPATGQRQSRKDSAPIVRARVDGRIAETRSLTSSDTALNQVCATPRAARHEATGTPEQTSVHCLSENVPCIAFMTLARVSKASDAGCTSSFVSRA